MVEIQMPDPIGQHRKTPAYIRVVREYIDPETGQPAKRYLRKLFTVGSGEDMRVLRWHEVADRIENYVKNHTLAELKQVYMKITGEEYEGVDSKKGVVRGVLAFYFGFDEEMTLAEMQAWFKMRARKEGRWGLGCPGCGAPDHTILGGGAPRFWEFKPTDDELGFEAVDQAAMMGPPAKVLEQFTDPEGKTHYLIEHWDGRIYWTEEIPINRGYLDWKPQPDGSVLFNCDRCGSEVRMVR